jgi:acetyl-CoA carboxylase biotin carboxyl carrier protein
VPLNDDDVREILRIIDESELDELRIDTAELSLHVVRDGAAPAAAPVQSAADAGDVIASPMLGTVYHAPAPGAAPFVEVGSKVEPDTLVCIIEVMKMMNSVQAGVSGTIVEVCVENGQLVEYDAPLFKVES